MNLYIEIENGQAKNHPALEDNVLQVFGSIPDTWAPFTRVKRPEPGVYEVYDPDAPTYEQVNGVWMDVWTPRNMTAEEKTAKQQAVIASFNDRDQAENWSAWVLDEATCTMQPPIPKPALDQVKLDQGIYTFWCGADSAWKDSPVRPENSVQFDFFAWQWLK
jgi:hypothetical protein